MIDEIKLSTISISHGMLHTITVGQNQLDYLENPVGEGRLYTLSSVSKAIGYTTTQAMCGVKTYKSRKVVLVLWDDLVKWARAKKFKWNTLNSSMLIDLLVSGASDPVEGGYVVKSKMTNKIEDVVPALKTNQEESCKQPNVTHQPTENKNTCIQSIDDLVGIVSVLRQRGIVCKVSLEI